MASAGRSPFIAACCGITNQANWLCSSCSEHMLKMHQLLRANSPDKQGCVQAWDGSTAQTHAHFCVTQQV